MAEATRLSFSDVSVRGTKPLELIHSDNAGPFKPSDNGLKYYVTFIDDFTGSVSAIPILDKFADTTLKYFRNFQVHIERVWEHPVKAIRTDGGRTDGGTEYKGNFSAYLDKLGIVLQITKSYTPQLNGVAERFNRTIKEMASAMLIDRQMDHKYWPWALMYATTILNATTIYPPSNKSVLEIQWGRRRWSDHAA